MDKIIALDTEDNSHGKVYLLNFFDGKKHTTFTDNHEAWVWLMDQGPATVWACNMEYDLINLFGYFLDKQLTLTYNTSTFIKAHWPGHRIKFRDTLRHWPMSVEKMGVFINLPKLKPQGDQDRFNDIVYCRRDTEIVFRFVEEMTARYKSLGATMKNTLPSTAFSYFKDKHCSLNLDRPDDAICKRLSEAAYGGRVEIFKTGLLEGPLDYYDVNSLYPYVMSKNFYPDPATGHISRTPNFNNPGVLDCTLSYPRLSIPGLPYRYQGKLVFPVGRFRGTWCYPEIKQALRDGAKIEKIHWVYEYSKWCHPFKDYILAMYKKRKAESDPLMNYTYKLFMNSVYGKFNESGELTLFKDGMVKTLKNRPKHANVILSAYTTSYARLHLLSKLREAGESLCYCDTDSVFIQDRPPLKTGPELGEFKHEGTYSAAHFVLPKTYLLVDSDGRRRFRAKGIPQRAVKDFFTNFRAEYDSPIRFRESRRRVIPANDWVRKTRALSASYEKRVILKDGRTEPILIK